ncbi:MAG: tRNA (guanosine(37)-N1)-methyltransferase TrmD [Proteobacteria bacterium]|nr:tRNA (guanosine(37)-N1)-methyltransferase TrmD [Pseudomonadota bacterium]
MQIHVITLFPELFQALNYGIVGRAIQKKILQLQFWNPRDFTEDPHRTVDDRPYGGGPGMVMKVAPLRDAIQAAKAQLGSATKVIYLSPQGHQLKQADVVTLANHNSLILLLGRYEGIDQRLIDSQVDEIWSVGDYVVSGGEIPAMLLIDAMTRLLPDALNHEESPLCESFSQGLLEYPQYTRPVEIDGLVVPEVLRQGDHQAIARWRMKHSLKNTWQMRPDLLKIAALNDEQKVLLQEIIKELPRET